MREGGGFAYGRLPHSTGHRSNGAGQFSAPYSNEAPTGAPSSNAKGYEHSTRTQVKQAPQKLKDAPLDPSELSPQPELLKECAIAVEIFLFEIIEKAASLADDLQ